MTVEVGELEKLHFTHPQLYNGMCIFAGHRSSADCWCAGKTTWTLFYCVYVRCVVEQSTPEGKQIYHVHTTHTQHWQTPCFHCVFVKGEMFVNVDMNLIGTKYPLLAKINGNCGKEAYIKMWLQVLHLFLTIKTSLGIIPLQKSSHRRLFHINICLFTQC